MREAFGDQVQKDVPNLMKDGKKVKNDFLKDGKRQFERHSGTGK